MASGDPTSNERTQPRIPPILRQPLPALPTSLSDSAGVSASSGSPVDRARRQTVRCLAAATILLAVVNVAPAVPHFADARWPVWAEIVVGVGVLQAAYALWLLTAIDWAAVRVLMVAQALVATLYGAGLMIAIATPPDQVAVFDLDAVRGPAPWWCPLMMGLGGSLTYFCGRISHRWRRSGYNPASGHT